MNYEERRPSAGLAPYVKCIWQLKRVYRAGEVGEVLWPDGCQELIFHYGAAYMHDGRPLPRAFFIGMLSHYHHLHSDGELRLFGARLLPWGLAALSDKPVQSFNDRFLPMTDALPAAAAALLPELERKLAETEEIGAAQELIEAFLRGAIIEDRADPIMTGALAKLYGEPLDVDVARAVRESGYSQRQFERKCAELTGLSPKRLNNIARFNQARLRLMFEPGLDLHECMLEFGYYDYAHFSKEFKRCLGITPARYRAWVLQMQAKLRGSQDVVFLNDKNLQVSLL